MIAWHRDFYKQYAKNTIYWQYYWWVPVLSFLVGWRSLRSLRSVDFCSMARWFLWDWLLPNIQLISLLVVSGDWDSLTRSKGCQWNYATNVPPDSRHSQWRRYECCTWGFYPRKMKEGSRWKGTISKRIRVFQPSLFRGYISLHGWREMVTIMKPRSTPLHESFSS